MIDPLEGLGVRWALPEDVVPVSQMWLASARSAWHLEEDAIIPLPKHLIKTIAETKERSAKAKRKNDRSAVVREQRLLDAIFNKEFLQFIANELLKIPPIILYDKDHPTLIFGWAHGIPGTGNWIYVKHKYRRLSYGSGLYRAIGSPKNFNMLTKAGSALVTSCTTIPNGTVDVPVVASANAVANGSIREISGSIRVIMA